MFNWSVEYKGNKFNLYRIPEADMVTIFKVNENEPDTFVDYVYGDVEMEMIQDIIKAHMETILTNEQMICRLLDYVDEDTIECNITDLIKADQLYIDLWDGSPCWVYDFGKNFHEYVVITQDGKIHKNGNEIKEHIG